MNTRDNNSELLEQLSSRAAHCNWARNCVQLTMLQLIIKLRNTELDLGPSS